VDQNGNKVEIDKENKEEIPSPKAYRKEQVTTLEYEGRKFKLVFDEDRSENWVKRNFAWCLKNAKIGRVDIPWGEKAIVE
jgi:hypothetical protein